MVISCRLCRKILLKTSSTGWGNNCCTHTPKPSGWDKIHDFNRTRVRLRIGLAVKSAFLLCVRWPLKKSGTPCSAYRSEWDSISDIGVTSFDEKFSYLFRIRSTTLFYLILLRDAYKTRARWRGL